MRMTRLYTGQDGQTHFEDIDVEFHTDARGVSQSDPVVVAAPYFSKASPPGTPQSVAFHNAPRRQYVLVLAGVMEIEVGSGEKREFRAGEIVLAEDLDGQGHMTRVPGDSERLAMILPLEG